MTITAQRIKEERKRLKLTQKDLGIKLGLAVSTISGYELGTSEPDFKSIRVMADFFNVSTDYLLGKSDARNNTLDEGIEKLKKFIEENEEYFKVIKKIKDNNIDIRIIDAYIDVLIEKLK